MTQDHDGDLAELLEEVRRIDVLSNRLVTDVMSGGYSSVFRGAGIEFDEVREYVPGDDPRSVDWNVTARSGVPFVKTYREERELPNQCLEFHPGGATIVAGSLSHAVARIDTQTFEMRRMESRGGVVVDFGPLAQFGEVRFPQWVEIREPQRDPVRLDVIAVTPVNAPAAGFQPAWLLSPSEPRAGASPGGSVPASSGEPSGR